MAFLLCPLVHQPSRQLQQADKHSPPKVVSKAVLVVYDVHMARGQPNLHRKVGEVGRDAAAQALQTATWHLIAFPSRLSIASKCQPQAERL